MSSRLPRWGLLCALSLAAHAQNLKEFEKNVTEFTLPNGLHFIVLERHQAPVVSFFMYVNAGSVDDPQDQTGIAHMFEHMIGKGTSEIGTKNWPAEKQALAAVEATYDKLDLEKRKGRDADPAMLKKLQEALEKAIAQANEYVQPNAYVRVIEESGGVGFNAGTGLDQTVYFYSLPANRAELWFHLQSSWLMAPVFREFYKERDVVREERRMRTESSPQGKAQEMLLSTAFAAQPYRTVVGWASNIENLRAKEAAAFHKLYYVPRNVTIAIAGDVNPAVMRRFAESYFGPIPAGPPPPLMHTKEPAQEGEKRVAIETPSQPFVFAAYKRPDQYDKDDPVFDVVAGILSSGRTGTLYKEMVRDKKISVAAGAVATFPSGKYPNLFLLYSFPAVGKSLEENERNLYEIVERLKKEKVDEATLKRVKTKVRAGLIRQLDSNAGLAEQLATYHALYGDWRKFFTAIEEIEKVTADDVQRVAKEYFDEAARTVTFTRQPASVGDAK